MCPGRKTCGEGVAEGRGISSVGAESVRLLAAAPLVLRVAPDRCSFAATSQIAPRDLVELTTGGEGEIRTRDRIASMPVFKSDHPHASPTRSHANAINISIMRRS